MLEALSRASGPVVASKTSWPKPLKNTRSDSRNSSLLSTINIFLAVFRMEGISAQGMPVRATSACWYFLADSEHPEIFRTVKDNCRFVIMRIDLVTKHKVMAKLKNSLV